MMLNALQYTQGPQSRLEDYTKIGSNPLPLIR